MRRFQSMTSSFLCPLSLPQSTTFARDGQRCSACNHIPLSTLCLGNRSRRSADPSADPPASTPEKQGGPSESIMAALQNEFIGLVRMEEAPQERGYAFERFLKRWFDTWGLDAHASFRTIGEQIDGSF